MMLNVTTVVTIFPKKKTQNIIARPRGACSPATWPAVTAPCPVVKRASRCPQLWGACARTASRAWAVAACGAARRWEKAYDHAVEYLQSNNKFHCFYGSWHILPLRFVQPNQKHCNTLQNSGTNRSTIKSGILSILPVLVILLPLFCEVNEDVQN